jgi:hypothetical protein
LCGKRGPSLLSDLTGEGACAYMSDGGLAWLLPGCLGKCARYRKVAANDMTGAVQTWG